VFLLLFAIPILFPTWKWPEYVQEHWSTDYQHVSPPSDFEVDPSRLNLSNKTTANYMKTLYILKLFRKVCYFSQKTLTRTVNWPCAVYFWEFWLPFQKMFILFLPFILIHALYQKNVTFWIEYNTKQWLHNVVRTRATSRWI